MRMVHEDLPGKAQSGNSHRVKVRRALVVDDDPIYQEVLMKMLSVFSCSASGANSGQEALDRLVDSKVDLIFMDLNMPGMDGVQTLARIRDQDQVTPVVFVTAYPDHPLLRQVDRRGPVTVLRKPLTLNDLATVLS